MIDSDRALPTNQQIEPRNKMHMHISTWDVHVHFISRQVIETGNCLNILEILKYI